MQKKESIPTDETCRILAGSLRDLVTGERLYLDPRFDLYHAARMLKTNRVYLSRAVNRVMGYSFTWFLNGLRIAEGKRLIGSAQQLSLEAIARMSGFGDRKTFYSAFKRETGQTPSQYRESLAIPPADDPVPSANPYINHT